MVLIKHLPLRRRCHLEDMRPKGWMICAFGLVFVLFHGLLVAAEDNPDSGKADKFVEPVITEETMPNEPGELSLRWTWDYRRGGDATMGVLPRFQVFYGLVDRVGFSLALPFAYESTSAGSHYGLGDLSLDCKFLVLKPQPVLPAVVLGLETSFPTGDSRRGLGEGAYEISPFFALLKEIGPVCVQGNCGWARQLDVSRENRFTYGWALSTSVLEGRVHFLAEIQGEAGPTSQVSVAPAFKLKLLDGLTFGLAVPFGLNRNTADWGVVSQFQIDF
jgi:hypothetical protein